MIFYYQFRTYIKNRYIYKEGEFYNEIKIIDSVFLDKKVKFI